MILMKQHCLELVFKLLGSGGEIDCLVFVNESKAKFQFSLT